MRNGQSAFVLDKLFSTIDEKKGLAPSKTNYEVARTNLLLKTRSTRD